MKRYDIFRDTDGVDCTVVDGDNHYYLPHVELHSPTGFECGYGGSGPADLAASILADWLDVRAEWVEAVWRGKASATSPNPQYILARTVIHLHQRFKADFIAPCAPDPGEAEEIKGDDIAQFIANYSTDGQAKRSVTT